MSYREEVAKRRREMCSFVFRGMPIVKAAEILAQKYDVKKDTLKVDWSNREEWIPELFDLQDEKQIILDIIAEQKEIKKHYWRLFQEAQNNYTVQMGLLKGVQETNDKLLTMLQSLGKVHKEPDKLELEKEERYTITVEDYREDDETRELLEQLRKRRMRVDGTG